MRYFSIAIFSFLIFGCDNNVTPTNKPIQLKTVTNSFQSSTGDFTPADRTVYFYDQNGKIQRMESSNYNSQTKNFEFFSKRYFTYSGSLLITIEDKLENSSKKTITHYLYNNLRLSKIVLDDDIDTEASFIYPNDDTVEVDYNFSNGSYFKYRFALKNGSVTYEQTLDESNQITSEVSHEYDNNVSPYSLGYTDIVFRNYSAHNKTKTSSAYYGAFPELVPIKYEYLYNNNNLPTQQLTTYQKYPNGVNTRLMKTTFEY